MGDPLTADWLRAQRWFRSKQRPIDSLAEVDRAPLSDHAALTVIEVSYADGGSRDRYLVPMLGDREPADGDGAWRAMLGAIADDATVGGTHGTFLASRTDALDVLLPSAHEAAAALDERRLRVEQSNTSVVLGERLILKLYRLLEPGISPDLEVSAFLTDAGFADTPAVAGSIVYEASDAEPAAAAMLQAFVPSTGDAWAAMLDGLASDPVRGTDIAAAVGDLTGRMHRALASRPDDPAFPSRPATTSDTAGWRASAEAQLAQAVSAVSGEAHDRLVSLAPRIRAHFADTFGAATGEARVSRIHGDYHLGQLLSRRDAGFSVIDFEGEPARPLAERRLPSSPLRDVAGMLRSLDYAARTAEAGRHADRFDAEAWLAEARAAFLNAYGPVGDQDRLLLDAFELEKACYEVRYEANNRPSWLWLPLAAVERLAFRVASRPMGVRTGIDLDDISGLLDRLDGPDHR
jgi:maltose alpha-D-glucosyltransferase/alpha-amylase